VIFSCGTDEKFYLNSVLLGLLNNIPSPMAQSPNTLNAAKVHTK
jgi:hypothetical protein